MLHQLELHPKFQLGLQERGGPGNSLADHRLQFPDECDCRTYQRLVVQVILGSLALLWCHQLLATDVVLYARSP